MSRSLFELAATAIPFTVLFALSWMALSVSPWLALGLSLVNSAFVVRLFMVQHDCGHGAYFRSRELNDWLGRVIGVLTITPYDVWRRNHAIHHATTGNLDRRGVGDIPTMTVAEYRQSPLIRRFLYRLLRHPVVLFGIVPFYTFFLQNRIPIGQMRSGMRYWISALGTNVAIFGLIGALYLLGGVPVLVFVYLPMMLLAASAGMWLFYVQHQFEETTWERDTDWSVQDAAFEGSSHYVLPPLLRWITADIGVHHVHHLASKIPFYRLGEVLRDHEALSDVRRITLRESLGCTRLALWDEDSRKLVSFAEARYRPA
ncbi:fatty acid desaturase [Roseibacterium sp. SDUM158016]|uniref:fatty acid desaturase n=1 Tax=Roseicyclus sediminis TaxID=2980997 RepID=UPI0021D0A0EB|nr:fatty acid desaturase [Roseibacterium sp. SDUM158016]MCU4652007.1 fatty acid desaturase [Roseibacterium sp. SDUM158016]